MTSFYLGYPDLAVRQWMATQSVLQPSQPSQDAGAQYDSKVEYIETSTSETQWIDTGIVLQAGDEVDAKFHWLSFSTVTPNANAAYFGSFSGTPANKFICYCVYNYNRSIVIGTPSLPGSSSGVATNTSDPKRIVTNGATTTIYNGDDVVGSVNLSNYTLETANTCYIFSANSSQTGGGKETMFSCGQQRCYGFKITRDGSAILNLVPVRKDGVGYMYDTVGKTLLGNLGTGSFTYGEDIN